MISGKKRKAKCKMRQFHCRQHASRIILNIVGWWSDRKAHFPSCNIFAAVEDKSQYCAWARGLNVYRNQLIPNSLYYLIWTLLLQDGNHNPALMLCMFSREQLDQHITQLRPPLQAFMDYAILLDDWSKPVSGRSTGRLFFGGKMFTGKSAFYHPRHAIGCHQ